jgi:predicted dehydrogenase
MHKVLELVDSGKYGNIKHISTSLAIPKTFPVLEKNDIRLQYGLGGGCMMDMGGDYLQVCFLSNRMTQ